MKYISLAQRIDYVLHTRPLTLAMALLASAAALPPVAARAQQVPGPADAGRVQQREQRASQPTPPPTALPRLSGDNVVPPVNAPAGAEKVNFTLRAVTLRGATALSTDQLADIYAPLIGQSISLARVYSIAAEITNRYRAQGYLLSYAYIPDQEVGDGKIIIAIAEGYLANVHVEGDDANDTITRDYIARLEAEKPLTDRTLESVLLRLNDLPGRSYRAVLGHDKLAPPEQATLTLIPSVKHYRASLGFDNFSSRYLGPNEINASYSDSFLPRQQTTLFGLTSIPLDKLNYGAITHSWVAAADWTLEGTASYTNSQPGYTLTPLNIDSNTLSVGATVNYGLIRQRNENLLFKFGLDYRRVRSDFLGGSTLTHDDIRTAKFTTSYDRNDHWGGTNIANFVVTQGIAAFGASKSGDSNLSRIEADPDFTKAELSLSRQQAITDDWSVLLQGTGQIASGPLYASEEFGVGGQTYGRAYDSSEIVGDQGIAGMLELRYTGLRTMQPINFEPYAFIDSGFVTNFDSGQTGRESLTSAGGGVRFATIWGQAGMAGLAFPLSRPVAAPIYGQHASSPRIMVQVNQSF